jgi:hypothetical protein
VDVVEGALTMVTAAIVFLIFAAIAAWIAARYGPFAVAG